MLDTIKRILVTVISGSVVAYAVYLLITGATAVQPEYLGMNLIGILIMVLAAGYVGIVYGVYPIYHPYQKRIFLVLGLGLIFFGQYLLTNNLDTHVYASDITKFFGVLIVWFGATGILSKNKAIQEQKKESKMEIIEA